MNSQNESSFEEKEQALPVEDTAASQAEESELFQYDMPEKKKKEKKHKDNRLQRGFIRKFMPVFVLLAAALVLTSVYFVLRHISPEDNGDDDVNTVMAVEINSSDVKTMKVENAKETYTLYKKSGSVYKIEGLEDRPTEDDVISTSIGYLSSIESTKQIMVARDKLGEYGLKSPAASVTLTTSLGETVIHLGNQSAGDEYYFCVADDENNTEDKTAVYLMSEVQANVCLADHFYYYTTDISLYDSSEDQENITPVTIGGKKGTKVHVYMSDGETGLAYVMDEPINMPFSSQVMNDILELLTMLNSCTPVSDDVSTDNLAALGLADPEYVLTFANNTIERTILFGIEKDGRIYCMVQGGNAIYQIDAGEVSCLRMDVADMCDVITYTRDVDTLSRIYITSGQKSYDFKTTGTGDERKVTLNNKTVENSIFSEFYSTLLGIEVQIEGEKPAGAPYLSIEITLSEDGSKEVLNYYKVDDRYCYFEMNGKGMFYVKTMDVDFILENAQKVYNNEEIMQAW